MKDKLLDLPLISAEARGYARLFLKGEPTPHVRDLTTVLRAEVLSILSHVTGLTGDQIQERQEQAFQLETV